MTCSGIVHSTPGQFEAAVLGAPELTATAPSLAEALTALESAIEKRVQQGDLVNLDVGRKGVSALAGKYRDDPTLQHICDEAYRERGAQVQDFLRPERPFLSAQVEDLG